LKSRPIVSNRLSFWKHKNMARSIRWSVWRRFLSEENWWNLCDCLRPIGTLVWARFGGTNPSRSIVPYNVINTLIMIGYVWYWHIYRSICTKILSYNISSSFPLQCPDFLSLCDDDFFQRKTDEICVTVSDRSGHSFEPDLEEPIQVVQVFDSALKFATFVVNRYASSSEENDFYNFLHLNFVFK
jgi:hypothetical protein